MRVEVTGERIGRGVAGEWMYVVSVWGVRATSRRGIGLGCGVGRAGNGLNYVRRVALLLGSRRSHRSMCRIPSGVYLRLIFAYLGGSIHPSNLSSPSFLRYNTDRERRELRTRIGPLHAAYLLPLYRFAAVNPRLPQLGIICFAVASSLPCQELDHARARPPFQPDRKR